MLAGEAFKGLEGLVADLEPFKLHNADEFFATLPRLALLEFHKLTIVFPGGLGER